MHKAVVGAVSIHWSYVGSRYSDNHCSDNHCFYTTHWSMCDPELGLKFGLVGLVVPILLLPLRRYRRNNDWFNSGFQDSGPAGTECPQRSLHVTPTEYVEGRPPSSVDPPLFTPDPQIVVNSLLYSERFSLLVGLPQRGCYIMNCTVFVRFSLILTQHMFTDWFYRIFYVYF